MFADDLLLFAEATKEQMGVVLNMLDEATSCHFLWMWRNREVHADARIRPSHP
jgi:Zn-dependent protease with chaperone function